MKKALGFILVLQSFLLSAQIHSMDIPTVKSNPNETSIAINPAQPLEIVAASNINNIYHSLDGGENWTYLNATSPLGVYGDPVLHYSGNQLFYAHLSKTPEKEYGDWFDRIVVQKISSLQTWTEQSYGVGYNNNKVQDKPWLSSDNISTKYYGNVYLTWTEFDKYESADPMDFSRIRFSRYTPYSDSFSRAITISDTTGDCLDGDNTLEGAVTCVGSHGEVYAVWAGHHKIWFDCSFDGGISWGKDRIIAEQVEGWDMEMPNIFRANGMPFMTYDPKNEIIYICWADEFLGDADIWLIYSKDQGRTWSERVRLNQDETKRHQYLPNICFDNENSEVVVAYYDQRHSTTAYFYDIYVSRYKADGEVRDMRITEASVPLPGQQFFYGDYIDIDAMEGTIRLAYPVFKGFSSKIRVSAFSSDEKTGQSLRDTVVYAFVKNKDALALSFQANIPFKIKAKIKYQDQHGKYRYRFHLKQEKKNEIIEHIQSYPIVPETKIKELELKFKLKDISKGTKSSHIFRI